MEIAKDVIQPCAIVIFVLILKLANFAYLTFHTWKMESACAILTTSGRSLQTIKMFAYAMVLLVPMKINVLAAINTFLIVNLAAQLTKRSILN